MSPHEGQQNLDLLNRRGPTHRGPIRHGPLLGLDRPADRREVRPRGEAAERREGHPTVRAVRQEGPAQDGPLAVLGDANNS